MSSNVHSLTPVKIRHDRNHPTVGKWGHTKLQIEPEDLEEGHQKRPVPPMYEDPPGPPYAA